MYNNPSPVPHLPNGGAYTNKKPSGLKVETAKLKKHQSKEGMRAISTSGLRSAFKLGGRAFSSEKVEEEPGPPKSAFDYD